MISWVSSSWSAALHSERLAAEEVSVCGFMLVAQESTAMKLCQKATGHSPDPDPNRCKVPHIDGLGSCDLVALACC